MLIKPLVPQTVLIMPQFSVFKTAKSNGDSKPTIQHNIELVY